MHEMQPPTPVYEILLKGSLDPRWYHRFEGLQIIPQPDGNTSLVGPILDQAALFGVLSQIRSIGIPLLDCRRILED